jgi:hypothetical protein
VRASTRLLQRQPAPVPTTRLPHKPLRSSAAAVAAAMVLNEPQRPAAAMEGVTAGLAAGSAGSRHAACGYGVHPAAADAALHCGAVDPAAPRDGRTRVPAALDALHIIDEDAGRQVLKMSHAPLHVPVVCKRYF